MLSGDFTTSDLARPNRNPLEEKRCAIERLMSLTCEQVNVTLLYGLLTDQPVIASPCLSKQA